MEEGVVGRLHRWKPAAPKSVLLALGGTLWALAGVLLVLRGCTMLNEGPLASPVIEAAIAILSLAGFLVMFHRVAERYIARIMALQSNRPCLFAVMSTRGYLVMAFMITLGIALRRFTSIPHSDLGGVYLTIAIPLLVSSIRFFRVSLSGDARLGAGPENHNHPHED